MSLVAIARNQWGWAAGTGAMALVSYLIWPTEFPPRYGLDHTFSVHDDEFLPTMIGATGVPFLPGNAIDILNNGDQFYPAMLDVDNGPAPFTSADNAGLYADRGLAAARAALKPGGVLAVWSAWDNRRFEQRLRYGRFDVEVERVRGRLKRGGPRHTIFLGHKREA